MSAPQNHTSRHANGSGICRNILQYDCICTYLRVIADRDVAQNFRSRADVHVTSDFRGATHAPTQRHLLENKAIGANDNIWMNDYPVGMQNQQAAPDASSKLNFRACHNTPESVPEHR